MPLHSMHFDRRVRRLQMGTRKSLEEAAEECFMEEQNHNDVLK